MKIPHRILILCAFIICVSLALPISVYAHPGRTDSNGGHTDSDTGEYHYHHGYPAHDHYDMDGDGDIDCPYDFDDQTGVNSGSNSSNSGNSSKGSYTGTYTERNTSTSSNTSQTTKTASQNIKSKRLSFFNMTESLFLIIITILFGGPIVFGVYELVIHIVSIPCSWLWKLLKRNLDEEENWTHATTTANVIIFILLYVFFLFPVVEELIVNPNILAAILIVAGIFVFVGSLLYFKKYKSADALEIEVSALKRQLNDVQSEKAALQHRAEDLELMNNREAATIRQLKDTNRSLSATICKLQSSASLETEPNESSPDAQPIHIPKDVYFINGNTPVKGKISDRKPFGDFTVYVATKGKCFHQDCYCGNGLMSAAHLYEVLGKKAPCQRCAYSCLDTIPAWYAQVKKAMYNPNR